MNFEDDILIVDDEIPNLRLLSELLEKEGYQVRSATKPQTAIDSAMAKPSALILLDVRMPEMDGFELCRRLKQDEQTKNIPVIFVSALQEIDNIVYGFEAGGIDFISKPYREQEILARVRTHLSLHQLQHRLEQLVHERTSNLSVSEIDLKENKTGIYGHVEPLSKELVAKDRVEIYRAITCDPKEVRRQRAKQAKEKSTKTAK